MGLFQQNYNINPERGFPGMLARPSEPHATGSGLMGTGGTANAPSPGDPVYYDASTRRFRVPVDDTHFDQICGILGYRVDQVARSDSTVEYSDGDEIQFFTFGTIWVRAEATLTYGQSIHWNGSTQRWFVGTRLPVMANTDWPTFATTNTTEPSNGADTVTFANEIRNATIGAFNATLRRLKRYPVVCVSRDPVSSGSMAMAQIGYGRVDTGA